MMKYLKVLTVSGLTLCSLTLFEASAQTVDQEQLDEIAEDLSVGNYGSADSLIELDPVYLEDRAVDVELLSNPNPRSRIEAINEDFDQPYESSGVEIIEFTLPIN